VEPPIGTIQSAVWDLTSAEGPPPGIEPGSVDIVILIFVMSALHPDEWSRAIANIYTILKPGGCVLFRDYGRHDLTQLRFKAGRLLDDNFYIRGDKTRVYFFELDELALLFTGAPVPASQKITQSTAVEEGSVEAETDKTSFSAVLAVSSGLTSDPTLHEPPVIAPLEKTQTISSPSSVHPNLSRPLTDCPPHPLFTIEQLGVDRRLIVNRKRQLKMYRVWMQGRFRKLS